MRIEGLIQSSACDYVSFADVDSFRHAERLGAARSIPLGRQPFNAWRAVFRLPSCDLVAMEAFPRILEAEYRAEGGALFYTLEGNTDMIINGVAMDERRVARVQGEMSLAAVQRSRSVIAAIVLRDAAEPRGWPQIQGGLRLATAPAARLAELRAVTLALFEAALRDDASFIANSEGAQETLLATADRLLCDEALDVLVPLRSFAPHRLLVRQLDELIRADPRAIVYTRDASARLGVTARTLHNALIAVRGISLHRYLKLQRLWTVRSRIIESEPGDSIKAIALSHGFWHLGDFSATYRSVFGERPSDTAARAKRPTMGYRRG
jgi:AraC family ethanolamine operon transcriptional activator